MHDIIPDIHGQYDKLVAALTGLGYRHVAGAWRHSNPARNCVFLGDFIDRGPRNADVIHVVRHMLDAGTASALMGNHELNAIHYHTLHPETGTPLRARSPKNSRQHQSFLAEFSLGQTATAEAISWMKTLPLFLELDGFRAVHACWDEQRIEKLKSKTASGVLSEAQFIAAADATHPLNALVEAVTKGPEAPLPEGYSFADKDGNERTEVRVKWWKSNGESWADVTMSVPDPSALPTSPLPKNITALAYPETSKPVLFGHYWMTGTPRMQAPNALCLDYSAGKDGPLMAYTMETGAPFSLDRLQRFGA